MPITKAHILDVLRDPLLKRIRFSVGPVNINALEYEAVSDFIASGAINVVPSTLRGVMAMYFPQINTLKTRDDLNTLDQSARTNVLHECTHIISDLHKVKITRLVDEAAAYLAQVTYLLLLNPSEPDPPRGRGLPPVYAIMGECMRLVRQYKLGESSGRSIDQGDISSLANTIHSHPEYSNVGDKEMLAADGVSVNEDQAAVLIRLGLTRLLNQQMNEDEIQRLSPKVRYVAHENYVTHDPELLTLFDSFKRGGPAQVSALQRLLYIFQRIDQPSAQRLKTRLSTAIKGDMVSQRFQSGFPAQVKAALLSALEMVR